MNDHDVLTTVRDGFAPVQMSIPPDDIMTRGRSLRRRRHRGQLIAGGTLALALGAGLSVSALTAGPPAAQQATLAAWTVQRDPDGAITVTIRELRDLPALQARLGLDGAPVTISDSSLTLPHGCVAQAGVPQLLQKMKMTPRRGSSSPWSRPRPGAPPNRTPRRKSRLPDVAFVTRPPGPGPE